MFGENWGEASALFDKNTEKRNVSSVFFKMIYFLFSSTKRYPMPQTFLMYSRL